MGTSGDQQKQRSAFSRGTERRPRGPRAQEAIQVSETQQRAAAAELFESRAHLSALLGQASAGVATTDQTGRFIYVNDRYCEMLGRSRDELLTLQMQSVTHPDDLPGNSNCFRAAVEGGPSFEIEKRYIRPDGEIIWVRNSVTAI